MGDFGSEPRWRDLGDSRDLAAAVRSTYQPLTDSQAVLSQTVAVALDDAPAGALSEDPAYLPPPLTTDPLEALRESVSNRRRRPTLSGRSVLAAAAAAGLLLVAVGAGLPRALLGGVEPTESVEPFVESQEPPASDASDDFDAGDTPAWTYAPPAGTTPASQPSLLDPTTAPDPSTATSSAPAARGTPAPKRAATTGTTTTTAPARAQSPSSSTSTTSAPTTAPPQEPPPEDEEVPEGGGW